MSEKTYHQVTAEGFLSLPNALRQGAWGAVSAPDAPSPAEVTALSAQALCKALLVRALLALRRILHPDPGDADALFDEEWDRVQRLWASDIVGLENSKDPQARADGALLRDATLKGRGTAQTTMRYEDEVQWGFSQADKAQEPTLRAIIDRHGLSERVEEIHDTTSALADAIGWSADAGQRVKPSTQRRVALRRCAQACAHADMTLSLMLDLLPAASPEATQAAEQLNTIRKILG
jgi:hypothetical protein